MWQDSLLKIFLVIFLPGLSLISTLFENEKKPPIRYSIFKPNRSRQKSWPMETNLSCPNHLVTRQVAISPLGSEIRSFKYWPYERCELMPTYAACGDCNGTANWVVFWGDSHTKALFDATLYFTDRYSVCSIVINDAACPPVLYTDMRALPKQYTRYPVCMKTQIHTERVLRANHHRITRVFMTARWEFYAESHWLIPNYFIDKELNRSSRLLEEYISQDRPERIPLMGESFRQTLTTLKYNWSVPVTVIGMVPNFGKEPYGRKFQRYWKSNPKGSLHYSEPQSDHMNETSRAMLKRLEELKLFDFVDPLSVFCNGTHCSPDYQGRLAYRDTDHLSPTGAMIMACLLEPYFHV